MEKYARIINDKIKLLEVGLGNDSKFYESLGFSLMEVEQSSLDGNFYKKGFAPKKSDNDILNEAKTAKRNEILKSFEINLNDLKNGLQVENIGVVDCGKQHLTNVQGLIKVVESGAIENMDFRLFDNSTTKLNLEQLKKIELAIILKGQELYVKKWELEQAINNASSLEEVERIKWEY